jgi:hypothetical protein
MIPNNSNRCRLEILEIINRLERAEPSQLEILEIINRLERAQPSQSRITLIVGVGVGRGSWDVVGESHRGRIRTMSRHTPPQIWLDAAV